MRKRIKSIFFWALCGFSLMILMEIVCFRSILRLENKIEQANAVFIFNGSLARVEAGYELAASHLPNYLIVSPATDSQRKLFDKQYNLPAGVEHIIESKARTTYENAFYARKIIEEKGLKSVALVTSDYHMPRSYFLLRMLLFGKDVTVQPCKVTRKNPPNSNAGYSSLQKKILYNEMIDLWGGVAEHLMYLIRGKLPQKSLKTYTVIKSIKSLILFDVSPGY